MKTHRDHVKKLPGQARRVTHINHGFVPESPEDDVVISGISGRLPESDNMAEFREHLLRGEDMVTEDSSRWQPGTVGSTRNVHPIETIVLVVVPVAGMRVAKLKV